MSDGVEVKITRADALFAKFRKLAPTADRELLLAAHQGAEEVASLARRLAQSSRVKKSIKAEPIEGRPAFQVVAGDESTQVELRKGSGKFGNLALMEEFGTKRHRLGGIFKGAWHPGNKPRPFFFPAFRLLKKKVRARMGRALTKAAKQVAAT